MIDLLEYFYNSKLLIIVIIVYLIYKFGTIKYNLHVKLGHHGPPPIPYLGNMVEIFKKGMHTFDRECIKKYGKIYPIYLGGVPISVIADEEVLKQILVKDFKCFMDRLDLGANTERLSKTVGSLKGKEWERVRNAITPTFTSGKLRKMSPMLSVTTKRLYERLMKNGANEIIDIKEFYGALTMDAIARTMFGMDTDSQSNPNNQFVHHGKAISSLSLFHPFFFIIILFPDLKFLFKKLFYRWEFFGKEAVEFFTEVVEKAIAEREKSPEEHYDFLGYMLKARKDNKNSNQDNSKSLTNEEVFSQCLLFLLGGYETTASSITFATYFLAMNPLAQDEVYEEIINKIGQEGDITYEALMEMPILDSLINETLRLCPSLTRIERTCVQDTTLITSENKKIIAKKGDVFAIPIYAIHMDPSVWPNPEDFDLHRFDPDVKHSPYSHMPFGCGPRICLGMRFALLEAKWALVTVLQSFKIKRCAETPIKLEFKKTLFTLPTKPILVQIEKRERNPA